MKKLVLGISIEGEILECLLWTTCKRMTMWLEQNGAWAHGQVVKAILFSGLLDLFCS